MTRFLRPALISLLIAAAVTVYDLRYPNYAPDQHIFGTMLLKDRQPDLFRRDFFFGDAGHYDHYIPAYRALAGRIVGDASGLDLLCRYNLFLFPVTFFFVWGFYRLCFRVTGHAAASWAVAAAAIVSRQSLSVNQFGIGLHDSMVAYKLFLAVTPWAIDILMGLGFRPVGVLSSFFITGLAANFHPIFGLGFAGILFVSLLGMRRAFGIGVSCFIAALAIFTIGFAPYILHYLNGATPHGGRPFSAAEFWAAFSPIWGYLPVSLLGFRSFLLDAIFLIVFSWLGLRSMRTTSVRGGAGEPAVTRFLLWLAGASIALPVFVSAALQAQSHWMDRPPLIGLEPMRWTGLVYIPLYVLTAVFLSRVRAGLISWRRLSAGALFAWAIVALFIQKEFPGRQLIREVLLKTGAYSEKRTAVWERETQRRKDLMALSSWVRSHSEIDALFFHPHYDFRFYAQRAIVIGWKDGSMLTRAGSDRTREWLERARLVREAVASKDAARVFDLASSLRCDYVILRTGEGPSEGIGAPLYENATYRVYRVEVASGKS